MPDSTKLSQKNRPGKVGDMVFDPRYTRDLSADIGVDNMPEIRCPVCGNLLARGRFQGAMQFMCKQRGKKSRHGCGNMVVIVSA